MADLMKAIVFKSKCEVAVELVPRPQIIDQSDAIVKISLAGLCGSDLHPYYCRESVDPGCIMGHEFVGHIEEIGSQVTKFKVGQRVGSPFTVSCGNCTYCKRGLTARCIHNQCFGFVCNGSGLQGAQAQYIRVPLADSTLVAIPDELTDEESLLLGDIFSTGYFAADNALSSISNSSNASKVVVAVIGCGPVGLMAILGAKHLGAETVYAIDRVKERLEFAERYGAIPINGSQVDPVSALSDVDIDAVIEVVGMPSALDLALDIVAPGGVISSCGCHAEATVPMVRLYDKNLTLKSGRCPARYYFEKLLPLSKTLPITDIITHRLKLEASNYELFDKKLDGCIKVVMDPWM